MQSYIQHRQNAAAQEQVAWTVGMPAQPVEGAVLMIHIMIDNEPVFFKLTDPALVRVQQLKDGYKAGVFKKAAQYIAVLGGKGDPLDHETAIGVLPKLERYTVYLVNIIGNEVLLYGIDLGNNILQQVLIDKLVEMDIAVTIKEIDVLLGQSVAQEESCTM